MKTKLTKLFSILLTVVMIMNMMPLSAFADTSGNEQTDPEEGYTVGISTTETSIGDADNAYFVVALDATNNYSVEAYARITDSSSQLIFREPGVSKAYGSSLPVNYQLGIIQGEENWIPSETDFISELTEGKRIDSSNQLGDYYFSWSSTPQNGTVQISVSKYVNQTRSNNNVIVSINAEDIDLSADGSRYFVVVGSNDDLAPYQWTEIDAASPAGEYGFYVENLEQIENDPDRTLFVLIKRYESGETPTPETLDHDIVFNWTLSKTIAVGDDDYDFTWAETGKDESNRSTFAIGITKEGNQGGGDEPSGDEWTAEIKLGKGVEIPRAHVVFFAHESGKPEGPADWYVAYYEISDAVSGKTFTVGSGTTFTKPNHNKTISYDQCDYVDVWLVSADQYNGIASYHLAEHGRDLAAYRVNEPQYTPGTATTTYEGKTVTTTVSGSTTTIQVGTMPDNTVAISFTEDGQTVTPSLNERYYVLAGKTEDSFDFYAPVNADGTVGAFTGEGVLEGGHLPGIQSIQLVKYTGSNANPTLTDLLGAETSWIPNGGSMGEYTVSNPETLEPDDDIIRFTAASPKRYTSAVQYYENGALQQGSATLDGNYYIVALDNGEPLYYAAVPSNPNPADLTFKDSEGNTRRLTGGMTFEIRKANNGDAPMSEVISAPEVTTLGQYVVSSAYDEGSGICTFTATKSYDKFVKVNYYQNGGAETDPSPVLTGDYYMVASVNGEPAYYAKVTTSGENYAFSNGADMLDKLPADAEIKLVEYTGTKANPTLDDVKDLSATTKLGKYEWSRDESVTDGFVFKAVASNKIYVRVSTYENDNETPLVPEEDITGQYYVRVPLYGGTDGTEVVGYTIQPFTFAAGKEYTDVEITNKFVALTDNVFDENAQALDLTGNTIGVSEGKVRVRVFRIAEGGHIPASWAEANDTDTPIIDDTAPNGWAYDTGEITDDGCNVHLKRAAKPKRYHVRLKFDTTNPAEINLDGGAWLKVTVGHDSGGDTYGFIKLSNAVHKKAEYMTVDQENGCTYIDIPITEWKNAEGVIQPLEKYTGNEQSISVTLASGPDSAIPRSVKHLPVHEYINSFEIEEYPDGSEDNHLELESANFIDVYDVVTLDQLSDKFNGYTLEAILNGYNIVTLCPNKVASPSNSGESAFGDGDFLMKNHCMGGVLIRGDVIHISGTGVADSENITKPSVVGGYVPSSSDPFFNNRVNNPNPWNGYVGEVNTVVGEHMVNGVSLQADGKGYTGTPGTTIATDDYIDWDRLQNMVVNTSDSLAAAATEQAYTGTTINVVAGSNVYIDFPQNTLVTINIIALDENNQPIQDPNDIPATVITNKGTGTYIPPKLQINGHGLETTEDGRGMSLLWNFPNAKRINLTNDATPEFGHVIAPRSFIDVQGGNYSGCMVGNKVASAGEGHLYPYHGSTLIGFYGDLGFEKTVNGAKPTEKQKYDFTLEKLTPNLTNSEYSERMAQLTGDDKEQQVFWQRLQTVRNVSVENQNTDSVFFEDISFDTAGKYYFRVFENPAVITNTELDSRQFLIEITVASIQDPNDTTKYVLQVTGIKYYEIDTDKQLLNISSSNSGKSASLNMAAIGSTHTLSWNQADQNCNTGITFDNTVTSADYYVTLEGVKHLEGRKLRDREFHFEVMDVTDENPDNHRKVAEGTNFANGTFDNDIHFSQIAYHASDFESEDPGTVIRVYTYKITEVMPEEATADNNYTWENITYDPTVITATVTVTYNPDADVNNGESFFTHQVDYSPEENTFSNTYTATIETDLKAEKSITGQRNEFKAGDSWTFTVTAEETTDPKGETSIPMPAETEIVVTPAAGDTIAEIEFGTITFTKDDVGRTYVYTIEETGNVNGVTNDSSKTVEITVSENDDGTLSITRTPSSQIISFVNFDEGSTDITVEKIWKNSLGQVVNRTSGSATVQLIAVRTEIEPPTPPQPTEADLDVVVSWANNNIPSDAVFTVTTNGTTITLNNGNSYRGKFEDLTIGETYTLTVEKTAGDGTVLNTETVTTGPIADGQNTATISATYTPQSTTRDLAVSISWANNNAPGEGVNITATAADGKTVILNSGNNWSGVISGLEIGNRYNVQLTVPQSEQSNISFDHNPKEAVIADSNENAVVFNGTYTGGQPEPTTQDLTVSVNWTGTPSNVSVPLTITNSQGGTVYEGALSTQPWTHTVSALTIGETYSISLGTPTGDNASYVTVNTASPQTITLSTSNHTVAFNATYTEPAPETASLQVSINWDNNPSDLYVQVSAGDNLSVQLDQNNSWTGTINNLTVGQTYTVTAGNKWGNDAGNSSITNSPQQIQIASGTNTVTFIGEYTGGQSGGSGSIPVTINWDNEPSDVTVTLTATRNGQSTSIVLSGTGTTWTGEFTGLEENQNYMINFAVSGENANCASLDPSGTQYINAGTSLTYTGTYVPPVEIPEGKILLSLYVNDTLYDDPELVNAGIIPITITTHGYGLSVTYSASHGDPGATTPENSNDPHSETINFDFSDCSGEQWIKFVSSWGASNVDSIIVNSSNSGSVRAVRYIAAAGWSDVSFTGTHSINVQEGFWTLQRIIGDVDEADYELVGDPVTLQYNSDPDQSWQYTWEDLPEYYIDEATGKEYNLTYYVIEISASPSTAAKTNAITGNAADGYTVTNTEGTTSLSVDKAWLNAGGSTTWPEGVTVDIQLTADGEAVDGKTATLSEGQTSYTFEDLPKYQADGTTEIAYSVEEVEVASGYESEVGDLTNGKITITNTYSAVGEGEIKVQKVLDGREWTDDDTFEFILNAEDGTPTPDTTKITITKESEDKTESFGKIEFTEEGTYTYTVTEIKGTLGGVKYDETEHTVTIKVIDDGEGHLVAEEGDTTIRTVTITNTYEASGEITFSGTKKLNGRDMTAGEFRFEILEDGETIYDSITTPAGAADGVATEIEYPTITYTLNKDKDDTGTHVYTVKETATDEVGITIDTTQYEVKVIVSDAGDGTLTVTPTEDHSNLNFVNTYTAETHIDLAARKIMKGCPLGDLKFSFTLEGEGVSQTKQNAADGTITFDTLKFAINPTADMKDYINVTDWFAESDKYELKLTVAEDIDKLVEGVVPINPEGRIITITLTYNKTSGELNAEADKTIDDLEFINRVVQVQKVDITDVNEKLSGAHFQVFPAAGGDAVDDWYSDKALPHIVKNLQVNVPYILHEEDAPKGYTVTVDRKFMINDKGEVVDPENPTASAGGNPLKGPASDDEVLLVMNAKTYVEIGKIAAGDLSRKKLAGAVIYIYDKDGGEVTHWTSKADELKVIEGLNVGEKYILHEEVAPKGYILTKDAEFHIEKDGKLVFDKENNLVVKDTENDGAEVILIGDELEVKPEFRKKIQDINDSIGEESRTGWQDSADYDIDDEVPYKLTATLANNVTDYRNYHITFHDTMEDGLIFNEIEKVELNGEEVSAGNYKFTYDTHSFELTLTWDNGDERITDTSLNGAMVNVYFNAKLTGEAVRFGSEGNVNTAYLEYSCNPRVDQNGEQSEETEETEEDSVIAFTYKVDVNKVTRNTITGKDEPLKGAEFKLEKKLPGNKLKLIDCLKVNEGTTFTFKGLDDGEYVLTETVVPKGMKAIDPIEFTVTAKHKDDWEGEERKTILTSLTGNVTTGDLTMEAEEGLAGLTGDVRNESEKTVAIVHKVWDDDDNREAMRPPTLIVELLADGTGTGKTVELNARNHWFGRISNLPKMNGDKEIKYTWREGELPEGYRLTNTTPNGTLTTLTNTYETEKIPISVKKVWKKDETSGTRPPDIAVQLYADGVAVGEKVTLSEPDWTYTWPEQPRYVNVNGVKREIEYKVNETEIPDGYVCEVTGDAEKGFVITNTYENGKLIIEKEFDIVEPEPEEDEETTDFEVQKIWVGDNDDADGNRPESITVRLYAGGKEIKVVTLNAKNGWKYHFGELPKFVDGKPIHYSVREDPVEGYATEIRNFTIYNKYQPELTQVTVRKVWNDENNKLKGRPTSIWMKLSNGMSVVLNENNGWTATITGLPTRINGKPAVYTWTEQRIIGYELESQVTEGSVTTFTNKPWTRPDAPSQGRKPKTAGDTWYVFEDYDTPLGVEVIINHVGDCFD